MVYNEKTLTAMFIVSIVMMALSALWVLQLLDDVLWLIVFAG